MVSYPKDNTSEGNESAACIRRLSFRHDVILWATHWLGRVTPGNHGTQAALDQRFLLNGEGHAQNHEKDMRADSGTDGTDSHSELASF